MASSRDIRRIRPRPWINRPPTRQVDGKAIGTVVLLGARHQGTISDAIVAAKIKATRKSAAQLTLTVADPERELLGRLLDRAEDLLLDDNIDTEIGGIWWRLMGVEPTDDGWTMSFEDRAGAWLRRHDKPIRAVRGRITRAQFIHRLYREAGGGIDLWVPELRDKQRIAAGQESGAQEPGADAAAGSTAGSGEGEWVDPPSKIQSCYGPIEMTPERLTIAAQLLTVAARKQAPEKAALALAMAGIVESKYSNPTVVTDPGSTSIGTLQAQVGLSAGPRGTITREQALDTSYMAESFLEEPGFASKGGALRLVRENPGWTAGQIAQRVEMSGRPERYDQCREGAEAILKAFRGGALVGATGGTGGGSSSDASSAAYVFERGQGGKREDSLTCANRLADEVEWRHWIYGGQGYYASDAELINGPIVLRIERKNPAVVKGPTWKWDVRHTASQMRVELIVDRLPEPGQVAYVRGEGPASGRWLVDSVDAELAQPVDLGDGRVALRCSLELLRAQKKKPEPAPQAQSPDPDSSQVGTTGDVGTITSSAAGAKSIVDQAVQIAERVGGEGIWVASAFRSGSVTTSGNPSDHGSNGPQQAARDIAVRGIDALVGPPSPKLDRAVEAIGKAFGRDYQGTSTIIDTFNWNGWRVQIIWRTPQYGGHMGHIHIGVRRA